MNLSYEFRKRQLENMYRMLDENADAWCEVRVDVTREKYIRHW